MPLLNTQSPSAFLTGVHRGHVAVIEATKALADKAGAKMAVVTFDPHPATLVRPEDRSEAAHVFGSEAGAFGSAWC